MKRPGFFRHAVLAISFSVLLMSWEYQLAHASLVSAPIPEDSIRLRILAHSDAPADQWIKRKVRDEVMRYVQEWYEETGDPEVIRAEIAGRIDEFGEIVGKVLRENGYDYPYTLEYGRIDFPVKPYGHRLYPAGEYEALRIVIGDGRGENWWCVLFPPLCFADMAAAKEKEPRDENPGNGARQAPDGQPAGAEHDAEQTDAGQRPDRVEMRFYFAELLSDLVHWFKNRFS
jgi:stage II sporulation protein R